MSKNITIIPPSESRPDILRVTAYCGVSTDLEEQASSYASQIHSYTELISQYESWWTFTPMKRSAERKRTSGRISSGSWPTAGGAKSTG